VVIGAGLFNAGNGREPPTPFVTSKRTQEAKPEDMKGYVKTYSTTTTESVGSRSVEEEKNKSEFLFLGRYYNYF
jgi:hypothetical protein